MNRHERRLSWRRSTKKHYTKIKQETIDYLKKRDGPGCAVCGSTRQLEIHHKGGEVDHPEWGRRHTWKNKRQLQLVCATCHPSLHSEQPPATRERYRPSYTPQKKISPREAIEEYEKYRGKR